MLEEYLKSNGFEFDIFQIDLLSEIPEFEIGPLASVYKHSVKYRVIVKRENVEKIFHAVISAKVAALSPNYPVGIDFFLKQKLAFVSSDIKNFSTLLKELEETFENHFEGILTILAKEPEPWVRLAVCSLPNSPKEAILALVNDENKRVRDAALRHKWAKHLAIFA